LTTPLCFQGVIRASVTQDHNATQMKPLAPLLEIKLPVPADGSGEKQSPQLATTIHSDKNIGEEDGEDEDDWDAFQSFPASTSAAVNESQVESVAKEPGLVENPSLLEINARSDDFQDQPLNNVEEINNADHQEAGEDVISDTLGSQVSPQSDVPSNRRGMHEVLDFQAINNVSKPYVDQHQEKEEEVVQSQEREEAAVSSQKNEQISSDLQPVEVAEGLVKVNVVEDHEVRRENPDNKIDQLLSESSLPLEEVSDKSHGEGN
jgi:hypothetical protein